MAVPIVDVNHFIFVMWPKFSIPSIQYGVTLRLKRRTPYSDETESDPLLGGTRSA